MNNDKELGPIPGYSLLPCPFCGAEPEVLRIGNEFTATRSIVIRCPKCRCERRDKAIRKTMRWLEGVAAVQWNTRTRSVAIVDASAKTCGTCRNANTAGASEHYDALCELHDVPVHFSETCPVWRRKMEAGR